MSAVSTPTATSSRADRVPPRAAAHALAPIAKEHDLLICRGNGPQVDMLALESASDATLSRPYPLDDLVAQTQGMIGCWLIQSLRNAGVTKSIIGLITQTEVDSADPAFTDPSKFVGPGNSHDRAQKLANQHGWTVAPDVERWRRGRPPSRSGSSSRTPSLVCWTRERW